MRGHKTDDKYHVAAEHLMSQREDVLSYGVYQLARINLFENDERTAKISICRHPVGKTGMNCNRPPIVLHKERTKTGGNAAGSI